MDNTNRPTDIDTTSAFSGVLARLRRLHAVLTTQKPGFDYWPVHVRVVVDRVTSGQIFLSELQCSPVGFITATLHSHIASIRVSRAQLS